MVLQKHYDELWRNASEGFRQGLFELDSDIDNPADTRAGLTLLIRPPQAVAEAWQAMRHELEAAEPGQYYYPVSDLHITVMSIISCYPDFALSTIDLQQYITLIRQTLDEARAFTIDFSGITASPSCILLQGFPANTMLEEIRNGLRQTFKSSPLVHSIDKRYTLQTAHVTAVRFKSNLTRPERFLNILNKYRTYAFGTGTIHQVELVYNDWYQRNDRVTVLERFTLQA